MRIIIALIIQIVFMTGVFAGVDIKWEKKDFPEIKYLYSDHGSEFGSPDANEESKRKSYESVKRLLAEARSLKVPFVKPVFFRFDLRAGKVIEAGLEIQIAKNDLVDRTRLRPAGKYLRASFQGPGGEISIVFKQLENKLKEHSLTLLKEEAFYQKLTSTDKNPDSFIVLFPVKEK